MEEDFEPEIGIKFSVIISKGSEQVIVEAVAADQMIIKNVQFIPSGKKADDSSLYTGPVFDNLDESVQDAVYAYLEERGIDENLNTFVLSHSRQKEQKEYVNWLHKLLDFSEKK